MTAGFDKPKIIVDPLLGIIDVTDIIPLIDTVPFQSLGFKYQLGLASAIFPAATHTRKQHSLGAYERTRRLAELWRGHGFITEEEAHSLPIYALYHDIGHGPFSHVTESLGSIDHDERGRQMLGDLRDGIETAGYDYELVRACFARENPLYRAVFDKNLGTEKLDYLERDAFYTLGESPGVEYVFYHTYFIDGELVVHEVALDQAKDIQEFYIKMSKHVYLRKKSAILQRLVEKMTRLLMKDGLGEDELFAMTDFGLLGRFELSEHPDVRFYYDNFTEGTFPKLTVEFKYKDVAGDPMLGKKPIHTVGVERSRFDRLLGLDRLQDAAFLDSVEADIADATGIPAQAIIVVPAISKGRFKPQDMSVYTHAGNIRKMSELYPSHFDAMEEYGRSHLSIRVAVYEPHRRALYDKVEAVAKIITSINA